MACVCVCESKRTEGRERERESLRREKLQCLAACWDGARESGVS